MAIKLSDYNQTRYPNVYKSKEKHPINGFKFLMWLKIDHKMHRKIIGYSEKDKLTPKKASEWVKEYQRDFEAGFNSTDKITLNRLFELYTDTLDKEKRWYKDLVGVYDRYIAHKVIEKGKRPTAIQQVGCKCYFCENVAISKSNILRKPSLIGGKELSNIREMDVKKIISDMKSKGYTPRTQKSVIEVLNPLFKFAVKNKYMKENPASEIPVKVPNQKKPVTNATELFRKVYNGINDYYKDNPFYRAFFLFGFTGRRKSEILSLKWENIDFGHGYYWIEDTKNDQMQKYDLPKFISEPLLQIPDTRKGLVFKSPVTGEKIQWTERQTRQLKKHTGIEKLSLHYMRNILVSALAEQGTEAIVLSGILGHSDANTINRYLSINHHKSSVQGNKMIDSVIDVEVEK